MADWQSSACVLCSLNCGVRLKLGGEDGRTIERVKGDRAHPASQGYVCNKASRLNYYQNGQDRLTSPLRRRADGTFESIDWDTAITEIAGKLAAVRDTHGGRSIFYYGGGGQGNHLPGAYARATLSALGARFRSNALAQEKTGEFWVANQMFGGWAHGDFEHCEVALFIGKNPWHSHGIQRARATLKELAKDPQRTLIVIDPKRTETADLADIHLAVRPARDAWLLTAMAATIVQEGLRDENWMAAHVEGADAVLDVLRHASVTEHCERAGVAEETVRTAARKIAQARSVAVFEDLGVQMNRHSTLVSFVQRLLWVMTGNFGRAGTNYLPNGIGNIGKGNMQGKSPVTGSPLVAGLVPCNVIAEEILTDHPGRFRAMIVEAANPVHSLADSQSFTRAMRALDVSVVIDVAMSETARAADYVLPACSQYEKAEATFFNFEFPENYFHLRHPVLEPLLGTLPEAEIHARLARALGAVPSDALDTLNEALASGGRPAFAKAFQTLLHEQPKLAGVAPVLLFETLGASLAPGLAQAAVLWPIAHQVARRTPTAVHGAGFTGEGPELGEQLFEAIINSPSGVVVSREEWTAVWERVGTASGRINLDHPEMVAELRTLNDMAPAETSDAFPFLLSAGERRSFTANTVIRDPDWRTKDAEGALHISPEDARRLNLGDRSTARVSTRRAAVEVTVAVSERMQPGHLALPNGLGMDYGPDGNPVARRGVAPNDLTSLEDRDRFVGTPWHKSVPARVEAI